MAKFEVVASENLNPELTPPAPAHIPTVNAPAREAVVAVEAKEILGLMLKVLSQRAILLGHILMPVIALVLGFLLTLHILDNPTPNQLVAVGIYGIFALLLILVRKKP